MPVLKGRRANGHPIAITLPTGTPPSQVGSLTAGTPTTTTIPVTYTAATGTATITYSGQTSTDGGATYVANGGTFTGTGGTFTGLSPATAYRLRIIASNGFLPDSSTALSGTVTTASPSATTYTAAISPSSGLSGSSFSYTVTPGAGGWPSGTNIIPTVSGGAISPLNGTGSGTTPIVFTTVTATGAAGTNCVVNSSAAGMTNSTGPLTYTIVNPSTITANRYDIIPSVASAAPSSTVPVTVYLNAASPPSGSLTLSSTNGTFAGPINFPISGTSATVNLTLSGTAGAVSITGSNTAGLNNPLGAYLTCFSASSGTAQSITANSSYFLDKRAWQQHVWSGSPHAFTAATGRAIHGWGRFVLKFTPGGASNAVYARLHDALSTGANTAAGTGTALTNAAQVYGAVAGGSEVTLTTLLPAIDAMCYVDVACNASMSNAARIPLRFRIGDIIAPLTRSFECMWGLPFPAGLPGNSNFSPFVSAAQMICSNPDGGAIGQWLMADGVTTFTDQFFVDYGGLAPCEAGRMLTKRKGTFGGVAGMTAPSGAIDQMINSDGSPHVGFTDAVGYVDTDFRYMKLAIASMTGAESLSGYQTLFNNIATKCAQLFPSVAVICISISSGKFGPDGSSKGFSGHGFGYTRVAKLITDNIEPTNPMIVGGDADWDWDEFISSNPHASYASVIRFARAGVRQTLLADGAHAGGYGLAQADRYVTFSKAGTVSGDSIFVPFTLPAGASNLVALQWNNAQSGASWTYSTPTARTLCSIITVYGPNGSYDGGATSAGTMYRMAGVAIDNTNKRLVITIDRSGGAGTVTTVGGSAVSQPSGFTVQIAADFNNDFSLPGSNASFGWNAGSYDVGLFDDRTIDDCGHGVLARPQLDVVCN